MLEDIKLLLGISNSEKDKLLKLLIRQATDDAIEITGNECACELETVIEKMVVFNYNRLGTEGLDGESYSGATYTYSADYPENILRALRKYRKLKTL